MKYFKTSLNALFFDRHPWGTNRREAEVPWDLQPCNTTPAARVGQQRSTSTRCPDSSSRSHSSSWTSSTGAPSCRRSALLSRTRKRKIAGSSTVSNDVFRSIFVNHFDSTKWNSIDERNNDIIRFVAWINRQGNFGFSRTTRNLALVVRRNASNN